MPDDSTPTASVVQDPGAVDDDALDDWGPVPDTDTISGESHTAGRLLHRGPDGESECGIWTCTPGHWECTVGRDEFCHFLSGRATYTPESGEAFEVRAGTVAFFPEGWTGTCEVHDTVRKVYMCR